MLLKFRQLSVLQLTGPAKIAFTLGCFHLTADIIDFLLDGFHHEDIFFLRFPAGCKLGLFFLQIFFLCQKIIQTLLGGIITFFFQRLFLYIQLKYLPSHIINRSRNRFNFCTQLCSSLVNKVNRLIRQEPVSNIPVRHSGSRHKSSIANPDTVMHFVTLLQTAEDRDGILYRRLCYHYRLESALQGGIFLYVLAILIESGGTNTAQLTSGQHRLQQIACIHCSLGSTCTYNGVKLVDEQEDLPV